MLSFLTADRSYALVDSEGSCKLIFTGFKPIQYGGHGSYCVYHCSNSDHWDSDIYLLNRHYPKNVINITNELQTLQNILERLADIASSQDNTRSNALSALNSLNQAEGPLEICKAELKQLETKLTPPDGRLKQIGRALIWMALKRE